MSLSDKLSAAKLVSTDVTVCLDPDVLFEYEKRIDNVTEEKKALKESESDARLAKKPDTSKLDDAQKALEEYQATFTQASAKFKVTAMPVAEYVALKVQILDEETETNSEDKQLELVKAVLRASAKYVEDDGKESAVTDAQWEKIFAKVPYSEFDQFRQAVAVVNNRSFGSAVDLLKGMYAATQSLGETSE